MLLRESQIMIDYLNDHVKLDMQKIIDEISYYESLLRINSPISKQKGKSA